MGGASSAQGTSSVVQTEQVRAEVLAHAPEGVAPGKTVWLGLQLAHQPHWHTYWQNPGDSGLATELQWQLPAGVSAGAIAWPVPQKIRIGSLANFGFEGSVLLPVPLTLAPDWQPQGDNLDISLHASWLVCRQECIPQSGEFALRLPLHSATASHSAAFAATWAAQPQRLNTSAVAVPEGSSVQIRVDGLPAAWRGQALDFFPEAPALLSSPASPSASDRQGPDGQHWQGTQWRATIPLAADRSQAPRQLAVVLGRAGAYHRVALAVQGDWPAAAAPASVPPALQAALDANAQAAPAAASGAGAGWWSALGAALLGGLLLNLMPCVFPVLALKLLGFTHSQQHSRAALRAQGLAYSAGVILSLLALGGLMLGLRAAGAQLGWGFQLQSPWVISALALLFTLLGLNLAGLMELRGLVPSTLAGLQLRHPLADAFWSGLLVVAVASPCTAPFMGASLGYAIGLPSAQALGIFAALGLGLALPFLLVSWLPALAHGLPRPGAWMEQLRRFLAFPMAATVLWLVWVLGHLRGLDAAFSLLALLLGVAMLVWSLGLVGRARRWFTIISIAASAILAGALGQNIGESAANSLPSPQQTSASGHWQPWSAARVEAALAQGQPVFVDFTAAWCITCQFNKASTLSNAAVLADFAAHRVLLLRADWTARDPAITQALQALGRSGVPVYVLHRPGAAPQVLSELLSPADIHQALAPL